MISSSKLASDSSIEHWAEREGHELNHLCLESGKRELPELWETDLLVVSNGAEFSKMASQDLTQWLSLQETCGRLILRFEGSIDLSIEQLQELSLKPRTNYRPVDCGYYDHFEAAIVQHKPLRIRLSCFSESEKGEIQVLRLLATKTWRKEEFVEVESHGWMRADWVEMVDVELESNCSF